ncbi:MAG: triose-phosphate isomerase [Candidatus Woesearchaeota archaeon]
MFLDKETYIRRASGLFTYQKKLRRNTMRKKIIAGNWKMHMTTEQTESFMKQLTPHENAEIIIAPPFTALGSARKANKEISLSAQNMHHEEKGAFTGEISADMLTEIGCTHVILGHSERRHVFGEDDEFINKKVHTAKAHSLVPILCVGEKLEDRESNTTEHVLTLQLEKGLKGISSLADVVIAYEPVWAIGTGKTATPEQAQETHAFIRSWLQKNYPADAESVRILYGGSVKPENAKNLLSLPDIDGVLVGGASLDIASFKGIIAGAD